MKHIIIPARIIKPFLFLLDQGKSLGDLIARCWVSYIFLSSALSKTTSWISTIILFKYDYQVPLLSPVFAAYIGTGFEYLLSILLLLGLGGRLSILIFFLYNIFCVLSFHFLWTPAGAAGLNDHINWGLLLLLLMFHGSGKYSVDYFIHKKFGYLIFYGKDDRLKEKS
jgi:putative oxidoreductase